MRVNKSKKSSKFTKTIDKMYQTWYNHVKKLNENKDYKKVKLRRLEMLKQSKRMLSIMLVLMMLMMNMPTVLGSIHEVLDNSSSLSDPFLFMYDADELLAERLHEMVASSITDSVTVSDADDDDGRCADETDSKSAERTELLAEIESLPIEREVLEIFTELPDSYLKQALAYHEEFYADRFIVRFRADSQEQLNAHSSRTNGSDLLSVSFIEIFTQSFTQRYSQDLTHEPQSLIRRFDTQDVGRMELIVLDERVNPRELADELRASGAGQYIEYIQPDFTLSLAALDSEELSTAELSQVTSTPTSLGLGLGSHVVVAVIDTGIDSSHPMLSDYMVEGWNFPAQNNITFDQTHPLASAHGTHIAGIIASAARDSRADIQIMPLQVFENGRAYTSDIISAINFAVESEAAIINSSFGSTKENPALYEVITNANALFVCAVGNNRRDMDIIPSYPAAYRLPNVISVGSVNADGGLSFFSNYSASLVDITALGRDIVSALPSGQTGLLSGTSMSAAYITGIAAVLLSQSPDMTPAELREQILSSADRLSNLQITVNYGRRANMANALAGISGSVLTLTPADDFNVHGYQPTREELWELFAAAGSVKQVAGGGSHSLALMSDGTVWAWGLNGSGQLGQGFMSTIQTEEIVRVIGLTDIAYISAGSSHNFALRSDGTVWAWGSNGNGQLGDGTTTARATPIQVMGLTGVTAITAGANHSLALRSDGAVLAWGANGSGQLGDDTTINRTTPVQINNLANVTDIAAGDTHSLALMSDGTVWSWGSNVEWQLGSGTVGQHRLTPVQVSALAEVSAVSAGATHSLALRTDGTVWAWGRNLEGQLGNNSTFMLRSATPVRVSGLTGIDDISAGPNHSLALMSDGTVWSWGSNRNGVLGDGTTTTRNAPVQVVDLNDAIAISAGRNHNLALRSNGSVRAWGSNTRGQLGEGGTSSRTTPVQMNGVNDVAAVAAGWLHSLALMSDGTVWAWGDNDRGQLGDGTAISNSAPVQVEELSGVEDISAGTNHSLALRADGTVWSWGWNNAGQLGDGTETRRFTPAQVSNLNNVIAVSAGASHSIALRSDGTVWAWGQNSSGQLGDGTTTNRNTPVRVEELTEVIAIDTKASHNIALRSDGTVWSWGSNSNGALGDGTTTQHLVPVQANGLIDIIAVATGQRHSLALQSNGTVWAWGNNANGQLGNGTTVNRLTPIQVNGLNDVVAITAGQLHNLVLHSNGTVRSWGSNSSGQLGDGTAINRRIPVQVSGLSNITAISAGASHSLALDSDNRIHAWGSDREGQLGVGRMLGADIPARARVGDVVALDNAYITEVRALIEAMTFNPLTQAEAPTQLAAAQSIERIIGRENLHGVTATIYPYAFVPAVAGTIENPNSTNGSFSFTVRLNTGKGTEQVTAPFTVAVIAESTTVGTVVVELSAVAGETHTVFLSVDDIPTFTGKVFRLKYDPNVLSSPELIHQSNVTVISTSQGEVAFIVNTPVHQGTVWSGVLAVANFKASATGQTKIVFTIGQAFAHEFGIVRFHYSNVVDNTVVNHEVDIQILLGQSVASLGNLIPIPATRYGRVGVPGQVFMGWFTEPNPSHYINNPNRAVAFDFTQPITEAMLTGGVLNLYGSWLQFGDVNGDGRIDTIDLLLLQRRIGQMPVNIIEETADVNVDGRVDVTDFEMLQQFLAFQPVILGVPQP